MAFGCVAEAAVGLPEWVSNHSLAPLVVLVGFITVGCDGFCWFFVASCNFCWLLAFGSFSWLLLATVGPRPPPTTSHSLKSQSLQFPAGLEMHQHSFLFSFTRASTKNAPAPPCTHARRRSLYYAKIFRQTPTSVVSRTRQG